MFEKIINFMPHWRYRVVKPFKQMLKDGISLEMYYCIQLLKEIGTPITMSEIAKITKMPKQQMTKMVNKLIEHNFVNRVTDESDRRIIRLELTEKAEEYINCFIENDAIYFNDFFDSLTEEETDEFFGALDVMHNILIKKAKDEKYGRKERSDGEC